MRERLIWRAPSRRCEERSDAAIQYGLDCFAPLAMTAADLEISQ